MLPPIRPQLRILLRIAVRVLRGEAYVLPGEPPTIHTSTR